MARTPTDPSVRIRELEATKKRIWRTTKATEILTAKPMAEIVGLSWVSLRKLCNDEPEFHESGAFKRGAEGIEWQFTVRATITWLLEYYKRKQQEILSRNKRAKKLVAASNDAIKDIPDHFSIKDIQEMIKLARELTAMGVEQGRLGDVDRFSSVFKNYNSLIQELILGAAQQCDPNGEWPVEVRESVEGEMRNILVSLEEGANEYLDRVRGSDNNSGKALRRS